MERAYRFFVIVMLVLFAYCLGGLSGYVIGHNDQMIAEIAKYRAMKMKGRP